ncbi:hypothetical protein CHU92_09890 [Flavobacterium cyanobacteriorum]|uniref:Carboxypeptidase-like regulatory domain-containing protein n=1 Tax=Flavobacterium cyanobacteriorum TaxID=2022802 RepID=A0A255Z4G2_9FLAO|nr:DUF5686 and carboxypeptidase regulatory-like domain-containing protein [Flavobacterium cyanobacteriorum]OYQ36322.1 hypothetical protein CHU92_09890 [Flavobacterium cyanobacteriorum]
MKYTCLLMLLLAWPAIAQVTGKITSRSGEAVPFAGITVAGTFIATSTNENGYYSLPIKQDGNYTIIIRSLGYKTRKIKAVINKLPYRLDITLEPESYELQEIIISNKNNPATTVIKNAIAAKEKNTEKISSFEADFYSRGIFRIKDVPEKILGQELGDLGLGLDSARSGVIYLSETVSRIRYKRPGKINETVIASKVSGEDNGFSFNNAGAADFDFYNDYLPFEVNVVSPVAGNAFNYYDYVLESTFFDEDKHLINKIKITPLRRGEPAFTGYIYVVEGSWAIYAADVSIRGPQVRQGMLDKLTIRQNYSYNSAENLWLKNVQVIDFEASIFSVDFTGRFSYVYSNYILSPQPVTLSNEVITFTEGSNNKSESFWNSARPIPLTGEEKNDYAKKKPPAGT